MSEPIAKDMSLERILGNIGFTTLRSLIGIPLELLNAVLIARWLGPALNGQYNMTMLLASLLALMLSMSVSTSNIYYLNRGEITIQTALKTSLMLWLLFGLLGGLGVWAAVRHAGEWFPGVPPALLWGAWPVFALTLLQGLISSSLQALHRFKIYNLIGLLSSICRLGLILLAEVSLGLSPALAVGVTLVTSLITIGTGAFFLWPLPKADNTASMLTPRGYLFKSLAYGLKAHSSNILGFINDRTDTYMVNLMLGTLFTGYFSVASNLTQRLWIISEAISLIVFPLMSGLNRSPDYQRDFTMAIARMTFVTTLLGSCAFAVLLYPLLRYVFGEAYVPALVPALCLIPGVVLASFCRILANYLAAVGKPELNLYIAIFAMACNLAFNSIFIPVFAASGAALATSLTWFLSTLAWMHVFLRLNGIKWKALLLPGTLDRDMLKLVRQKVKL